jgi:hypothetical protein
MIALETVYTATILDEVATEGGKTFAIVIDEAHSSQGGKISAAMSKALGDKGELGSLLLLIAARLEHIINIALELVLPGNKTCSFNAFHQGHGIRTANPRNVSRIFLAPLIVFIALDKRDESTDPRLNDNLWQIVHQQQALGFRPSLKLLPPMNAIIGVKWLLEIGSSLLPSGLKFIEAATVEKEPSHRCERMTVMGTCFIEKGAQSYTPAAMSHHE